MALKLQKEDKNQLLHIAHMAINEYVLNKKPFNGKHLAPALQQETGAFVSVYVKKELRGCIGEMNASKPLWKEIYNLAVEAAMSDNRFEAVKKSELGEMFIEISLIWPMIEIKSPDDYIPDKHGIYLKKDNRSATFLPQVARKTGWRREEMLRHLAHDKAGLDWDDWKNADLFIYETEIISELVE